MHAGADRLAYLDGLLRTVQAGLADPASPFFGDTAAARRWLARVPMADLLVEVEAGADGAVVRERGGVRNDIAFSEDAVSLCILDGRRRGASVARYAVGPDSLRIAQLMPALTAGVALDDLARCGDALDVPAEELVEALSADDAVEPLEVVAPRVAPQFSLDRGDCLTWIGHAGFILQSGGATLWIDPWVWPKLRWTADERVGLFSPAFADSVLVQPYGPETTNLCIQELPPPDAVLITHQDTDHVRPGVLASLPASVPIVVPAAGTTPWEVPLRAVIPQLIGPGRTIVELGHGEHLRVGPYDICALPFHGEFPIALPHRWNCYLVQTADSAVAVTSDSKLELEDVDRIACELRSGTPLTLLAQPPRARDIEDGYRDTAYQLYNSARLWPWYLPPHAMFDPTPKSCVTWDIVARLADRLDLQHYFPCAAGSCPWFRLDADQALFAPISQMSRADIADVHAQLAARTRRTTLFPGTYGNPVRVG
jgi:L-ascorbate metabolism protein UlaG (beta-lactamase superfamily)